MIIVFPHSNVSGIGFCTCCAGFFGLAGAHGHSFTVDDGGGVEGACGRTGAPGHSRLSVLRGGVVGVFMSPSARKRTRKEQEKNNNNNKIIELCVNFNELLHLRIWHFQP